jgi:hypothetical protein
VGGDGNPVFGRWHCQVAGELVGTRTIQGDWESRAVTWRDVAGVRLCLRYQNFAGGMRRAG